MASPDDFGLGAGRTFANAFVGGVVAVLTAFVPLSPVLGGIVAGYLQRGSTRDGAVVGAIAGAISMIPILLLVGVVMSVLSIGIFGGTGSAGLAVAAWIFIALMFAVVLFYTVVLGALGGVIGNRLIDRSADRTTDTVAEHQH